MRRPLQDNSLIPHPAGDVLPVKIFKQRDGVFSANPGDVLEAGDVYRW